MKFAYLIMSIVNRFRFPMVKLFISKCLLFQSKEKEYWVFGLLGWLSLLLLVYSLCCIWFWRVVTIINLDNLNATLCNRIFELVGIEPTPARIALLTIIFQLNKESFSIKDVYAEVEHNNFSIGSSTVINTIRLFHVRGIIKQVYPFLMSEKAGRPGAVFVLSIREGTDSGSR